MEFTVEDFPTPPFPITRMVKVLTFYKEMHPNSTYFSLKKFKVVSDNK